MKFPTCYATISIGIGSSVSLADKVRAIASAGFDAIELSFPDLLSFAREYFGTGKEVAADDYDALCEAGKAVRAMCNSHRLKILVLQPFERFEGYPRGSVERRKAFQRAAGYIRIMEAVGTDMLQVVASDDRTISSSPEVLASDLAELADMLAAKGFRAAYENLGWASRASKWQVAWDLVQRTGCDNIGLCLDTIHIASTEWADPTTHSGLIEEPGLNEAALETRFRRSLKELSTTVPAEKIYFYQITDGYRMDPPLQAQDDNLGNPSLARWSFDYRPFPFVGYLPVVEITKAVFETGFDGFVSVEIFDGRQKERYGGDLDTIAKDGMKSCQRLIREATADGTMTKAKI